MYDAVGTAVDLSTQFEISCGLGFVYERVDLRIGVALPPWPAKSGVKFFPQDSIGTQWSRVKTSSVVYFFSPCHLGITLSVGEFFDFGGNMYFGKLLGHLAC